MKSLNILLLLILLLSCQSEIEKSQNFEPMLINKYIQHLEHNNWHHSYTKENRNQIKMDLEEVKLTSSFLESVKAFDIYQMDYGQKNSYHDGVHNFTILELLFENRQEIPGANDKPVQRYAVSIPIWPQRQGDGEYAAISDSTIFPIWHYRVLDPNGIQSEMKDYLQWRALRIGKQVVLIYSIESDAVENIGDYYHMLLEYYYKTQKDTVDDNSADQVSEALNGLYYLSTGYQHIPESVYLDPDNLYWQEMKKRGLSIGTLRPDYSRMGGCGEMYIFSEIQGESTVVNLEIGRPTGEKALHEDGFEYDVMETVYKIQEIIPGHEEDDVVQATEALYVKLISDYSDVN